MYQSRWAPSPAPSAPPAPRLQEEKVNTSGLANETSSTTQTTLPPISDHSADTTTELPVDSTTTAPSAEIYEASEPPPPDVSSEDTFAQTGAYQDDLFDDVNPMEEESMRLRSDDDLFNDDFTPAPEPEPEPVPVVEQPPSPPPPTQPTRARGDGGRGRGRGRGRGGRGDGRESTRGAHNAPNGDSQRQEEEEQQQQQPVTTAAAPENAPAGPRKETVAAVRGDRHATGGVRKPKLTEEELAEKMAEIQIKNASLTAAHARAEADAASFAEREHVAKQVADQRRKEERRDRQQMMGERERNRQRKLKAMEGREWDAGKRDEDFGKGGQFDKQGGFAGDKEDYTDGREYLYREGKGSDRGRGARRGGGRGGRGGRAQEQSAPKQEDFPELPSTATKTSTESNTTPAKINTDTNKPKTSWADQMESNTPS